MSRYSSATYYRLGPPPIITADQILEWINRLQSIGLVDQTEHVTLNIDYGKRIDRRHKTDKVFEPVLPPWWKRPFLRDTARLDRIIQHTHDLYLKADSLDELLDQFQGSPQTVQRAHVMFWGFDRELENQLASPKSDENSDTFRPIDFGLEVGPISLSRLAWDEEYHVSYLSMGFSGHGTFWPESFRQWVDRCAGLPNIQQACDICNELWPSEAAPLSKKLLAIRRDEEYFWPYDDLSSPTDWAWGPEETG